MSGEDRLRTLLDAMPDIVCFKDGSGRWLEANKADLELFQLLGMAILSGMFCSALRSP
ncbi:MAG: hypothetical protein ABIJ50_06100 [Pseudomonadota bacterium]